MPVDQPDDQEKRAENVSPAVTPAINDYVPQEVKEYMIQRFEKKNNIHLSNLEPELPVKIGEKGIIFPYRCIQKKADSLDGVQMIVLFAAVNNQKNNGGYVFKQSRIVSYSSYMAKLKEGDGRQLVQELIKIFPDLYG